MCQLSYIKLPTKHCYEIAVPLIANINTIEDHKDGFGYAQKDRIYKTVKRPLGSNFSNIGNTIRSASPVILHVRKASFINGRFLNVEQNHPFKKDGFILAHNGTLFPLKGSIPKDLIDTQFFFQKFCESTGRTISDKLIETMKDFYGKFAFIIRDDKYDYIIRGKTAELYISYLEKEKDIIGFIVNTEINSLKMFAPLLEKILSTFLGDLSFTYPVALEEESIFRVSDNDVLKIGDIKENLDPKKFVKTNSWDDWEEDYAKFYSPSTENTPARSCSSINLFERDVKLSIKESAKVLTNYVIRTGTSLFELERLFYHMYGISLLCADKDTLEEFTEFIDILYDDFVTGEKIHLIDSIKTTPIKLYKRIEFPYYLNSKVRLEKVLNDIST